VTKRVKLQMDKSSEELKAQDDTKTYIMSLIQEAVAPGMKSQASLTSTMNARYHYYERTRSQLELYS
jgi:hypothetical protein